jgi:hypothetical protein
VQSHPQGGFVFGHQTAAPCLQLPLFHFQSPVLSIQVTHNAVDALRIVAPGYHLALDFLPSHTQLNLLGLQAGLLRTHVNQPTTQLIELCIDGLRRGSRSNRRGHRDCLRTGSRIQGGTL